MKRFLVLAAAVAAASTVGCANARYVQQTPDEGVVAIPSNTDAWPDYNRTQALKLIEQHVGPAFDIVEEREVNVGTATTSYQDASQELTATATRNVNEYHIHYRRRAGGLTGFPGTGVPAGGMVPTGGIVPVQHTEPKTNALPADTVTPAGGLPPPDMTGLGGS
jgi:hypothetical protein